MVLKFIDIKTVNFKTTSTRLNYEVNRCLLSVNTGKYKDTSSDNES